MKIALLIRGESFRFGGQMSRNIGSPESVSEQIMAFNSHKKLINFLTTKYKIEVDLYLDTQSTKFDYLIVENFSQYLPISSEFHIDYCDNQMMSVARAISYIIKNQNFNQYDYILIIRFDTYFKDYFFEVFNPITDKLLFPSVCWYKDRKTRFGNPRLNDIFWQIPKRYFNLLDKIQIGGGAGHEFLDQWKPFIPNLEYDFILKTFHDSDSAKDWNPLYRTINRPEVRSNILNYKEIYPDDF
jgi:hypothetical protein